MADTPQLGELLKKWEESRCRGHELSPEELCRDCPELLNTLAQQIDALRTPASKSANTITETTMAQDLAGFADADARFAAVDYQIIRELGRGGMGIVYEAFDKKCQRTVALKTFKKIDPTALYRFKHEFRALADVTHPNLVPLFELISDGQSWFFTMEYVQGVDFLAYLQTEDAAPPHARLRAVLRQLAEGIVALHGAGKLHRDIKPSNVLVTKAGRVVLLDFGLAADIEYQSVAQQIVGTAAYMAPEQALGLPATPACDWYSVGVMLFEALTGRRPHVGGRRQTLMEKQFIDPPPPRSLVPDIPDDLNALCIDLLSRQADNRPTGYEIIRRLRLEGIGAEKPAPRLPVPAPRLAFVGRQQHLATLRDAFQATRTGKAVTMYVQGRSGLGKGALVQRFLAGLQEHDEAMVLAGRCYERESVPYKAIDSLIDSLSQYLGRLPPAEAAALLPRDMPALARVFPVLRDLAPLADAPRLPADAPDQQELRRRAFTALRELLTRMGDRRPLVLFIDDLQWGDPDSASLLSEVLRLPDPPVMLLIGCFRSEDAGASPFLRSLFQPREKADPSLEQRELAVDVLTPVEARELALTLVGPDDAAQGAQADAIVQEAGGNPLFVSAPAQHLLAGPRGQAPTAPRELSLDEVLWEQLQGLPAEARRLLEVLAVAGRPLQQADAYRAAQLDGEEEVVTFRLRTMHLVRGTGPRTEDDIEVFHDRVREIIAGHLSSALLKGHHARLAVTLEASGHTDPESLAIHFQRSEDAARAGHYYGLAAKKAAETLAFDRAAKLFRLALELQTTGPGAQHDLQIELAHALANAGRSAEAAQEYQAACVDARGGEALDLERRAAYHYCISGRLEEGKAAFAAVLGRVGMTLPRSPWRALVSLVWGQARLWLRGTRFHERAAQAIAQADLDRIDVAWSASAGLSMFDVIAGADFQTRNLLLSLRAGEPYRVVRALAWQAAHASNFGCAHWPRTLKLLDEARTLARRIEHPHALGITTLSAGVAEFTSGRWQNARAGLERAEQILRDQCTGVAWELGTAHTFSLWSLFYLGELARMSQRSALLLREAQERGDLYAATTLGAFTEAIARLAADDAAGARRMVSEFLGQWSQQGFHVQHMIALMSQTYIDLYCENGSAAWQRINEQWPALKGSHLLVVQVIRALLVHLRARSAPAAARDSAQPTPLLRAAERDARRLERERTPYSEPFAQGIRAGIAALRGEKEAAATCWASAAAGFDAADMGLFAAAARHRHGQILGGAEGAALIAAAAARFIEQGVRDPARMINALAPGLGALGNAGMNNFLIS